MDVRIDDYAKLAMVDQLKMWNLDLGCVLVQYLTCVRALQSQAKNSAGRLKVYVCMCMIAQSMVLEEVAEESVGDFRLQESWS